MCLKYVCVYVYIYANLHFFEIQGLKSREFALRLLEEKRCAIAPGIAFNTYDMSHTSEPIVGSLEAERKLKHIQMLDGFCRVSLANSVEQVAKGVALICDLLDELERR